MTLLAFEIATVPLALYLLALARAHFGARPRLVEGARDFFALGTAISGFVFIGPGQIAPPMGAILTWKANVWILFLALYFLALALVALNLRPRIVAYNATLETLRTALATVALRLDDEARWSGVALNMPTLGVQFYLEDSPRGRAPTVVAIGREFSREGWKRLIESLDAEFKTATTLATPKKSTLWAWFAACGCALLAVDGYCYAKYFNEIRAAAVSLFGF